MAIRFIDEFKLEDQRLFLRADFNVPQNEESGEITDDNRIRATLPTIRHAVKAGARLIIASHLGRPKGEPDPAYSLEPVGVRLAELLRRDVIFTDDCVGDGVKKVIQESRAGSVILLENLRFHKGETKNEETFARRLAQNVDIYINDAFGTMHRAHASTAGMVKFVRERGAGFLVKKELEYLTPLVQNPEKPYTAILGGAKISDKIEVIESLLAKVDNLLIGGGMAFTFLRAMGHQTGTSLVEADKVQLARRILDGASSRRVNLVLPSDLVVAEGLDRPETARNVPADHIPDGAAGYDIGPETVARFSSIIGRSRTIFNNGPMGVFERPPFDTGTLAVIRAMAASSARTIVGGGDSAAAAKAAGVEERLTHISTGGGASLEFVQGLALPGVSALDGGFVPEETE